MNDTYWYLATPYSKYPEGLEAAEKLAAENAALLLKAGIPTFCPIAHTGPLVAHGNFEARDHDFWINTVDRPLMRGAHGLIFLEAPSWPQSAGMHEEIVEFTKAKKPIVFMKPGVVPAELRQDLSEPVFKPEPMADYDLGREQVGKKTNWDPEAIEHYATMVAFGSTPLKAANDAITAWVGPWLSDATVS